MTPSSSVAEKPRSATHARNEAAAFAWAGDSAGGAASGSGAGNSGPTGIGAGTSRPASAMPRITAVLASANRESSGVERAAPSARAASTRARAGVRRTVSGGVSARRQPVAGAATGATGFTRSAIASTSPGGVSV